MADHELNMCPIWDITVSHTLAFLKYEPAIVDFSITLGGGRYGVAFALYDPAAFTARFGTPPTPLLPPWRCTWKCPTDCKLESFISLPLPYSVHGRITCNTHL